jgi:hypothetical protein
MGTKAAGSLSASCSGARRLLLRALHIYSSNVVRQARALRRIPSYAAACMLKAFRESSGFRCPCNVHCINGTQGGPFIMVPSRGLGRTSPRSIVGPSVARPRPGKLQVPERHVCPKLCHLGAVAAVSSTRQNSDGYGGGKGGGGAASSAQKCVRPHGRSGIAPYLEFIPAQTRHNAQRTHSPLASCSASLR